MAAVDYFLKIDGIEGESQDSKHKGEIELESFSWGVTQPTTIGGAGGGQATGRAQFSGFKFMDVVSKASPNLFLKCATGQHIKIAVLTARRASDNGNGFEFLKLTLSDVLVSSYQTGGDNSASPSDNVSLNFAKIEFSYSTQNADGNLLGNLTTGFDLRQNRVV